MTNMVTGNDSFMILAQATAGAPGASPSPLPQFIFLGLLMAAMYFLMIAPQRKKQKELEKMIGGLQSGDEVMTSGGIYGTITNIKDDRFVIRISDATKIEVAKGFITSVAKKAGVVEEVKK